MTASTCEFFLNHSPCYPFPCPRTILHFLHITLFLWKQDYKSPNPSLKIYALVCSLLYKPKLCSKMIMRQIRASKSKFLYDWKIDAILIQTKLQVHLYFLPMYKEILLLFFRLGYICILFKSWLWLLALHAYLFASYFLLDRKRFFVNYNKLNIIVCKCIKF